MKCFLVTAPCPSPTQIFKGIRSLCFGLAVVFILTFVLTMIAVTSSGQSNAQQQDEESLRDVLPLMSRVQELLKSGKVEEATALLKDVVRTTGQRLGEDNPNYAPFAMMLANSLRVAKSL